SSRISFCCVSRKARDGAVPPVHHSSRKHTGSGTQLGPGPAQPLCGEGVLDDDEVLHRCLACFRTLRGWVSGHRLVASLIFVFPLGPKLGSRCSATVDLPEVGSPGPASSTGRTNSPRRPV